MLGSFFVLICSGGEGNGAIQINASFVCSIKPNPFGLTEIVFDDFNYFD